MALLKKRLKGKESVDVAKKEEIASTYPTSIGDYKFEGRIGRGAFASVYIAQCGDSDERVAIKVIELELTAQQSEEADGDDGGGDNNDVSWDEIQKEAAVMARMQHRNIVSCHTSFCVLTELWLVMPLLVGSCSDIMKAAEQFHAGLGPDEALIATVIRDVLSAVHYIHTDGRVHRDIKAANILIRSDGVCQLSDFGVSGAIIEGGLRKNGRHTFTGSLWWMAPEVLQRENRHSYKADIWSLGILALELTFGKPPHSKSRPVKVMLTILQSPPPTIESVYDGKDKYSKKFKDFIAKCLLKDANKRLSAAQLLQHSWMKNAKNEDYVRQHILSVYTPNRRQQIRNDLMPYSVQQRLKKMHKQKEKKEKQQKQQQQRGRDAKGNGVRGVGESLGGPELKKAPSATMDSIRVDSNGFDFSSAINSVSQSGHHEHSPLSPDTEQTQTQAQTQSTETTETHTQPPSEEKEEKEAAEQKENTEAAKQLGRFDVTVQNKQNSTKPPPPQSDVEQKAKADESSSTSNVTKGRFKIKKIT